MKLHFYFLSFLLSVALPYTKAQVTENQREIFELEDLISPYTDEDFDVEDQLERISNLKKEVNPAPFSINKVNEKELFSLGLLSRGQIKSFLAYREQIGSFPNLYAIQAVPLWDSATISTLLPFLILSPKGLNLPSRGEAKNSGNHWQTTMRISPLNEKKQDNWIGDNQYLGINLRYSPFHRLKMGVSMEKDPGETLLKHGKPDYFSFFLTLQSNITQGPVLYLGDFKTSWGQGLLNASFRTFKGMQTSDISRNPLQINSHKSFAETGFFRGFILKYPIHQNITWIPMLSYKRRDASIQKDSLSGISQLLLSGYHRTKSERMNQENVKIFHLGNRIQWDKNGFIAGVNVLYQHLSPGQGKPKDLYNKFYYSGNNYLGISMDYHYEYSGWRLSGEVAYSKTPAAILQWQHSPDKKFDIALLLRYYPKSYQGLMAQAWGENSINRNERGFYLGFIYQLKPGWKVSIYHDIYLHPWLRYQINSPTRGMDQRGRIAYEKRKGLKFYAEWHHKSEEDTHYSVSGVQFYHRYQYRSHIEIPGKSILWRARFDWGKIVFGEKKLSGSSFWIEGWFKKTGVTSSFSTRMGLYNTPGYEVRFYHFEQQVTGVYGLKPYYGNGVFLHMVGKLNIGKRVKWEIMMRKKWGRDQSITLTNQFNLG